MNKRTLKLQKKKPYHFIISIVLIIIITFLFMFKIVPNGKLLYYVSYPCIYLKEKIATLKDNNKLVKENEILKNKIDEYKVNKTKNELLKEDINALKKMLDLNNIYNTYNIYHATIIDKNKDYYGSEIIIDKGKKSNIEKEIERLKSIVVKPTEEVNRFLENHGTTRLSTGAKMSELLKRTEITYADLLEIDKDRPELSLPLATCPT